jgi:transposase InsO family protein
MCEFFGVSKAGYYKYLKTNNDEKDKEVAEQTVIAHKHSTIQDVKLVADTVKKALKYAKANKTILHSDQGFQYSSHLYNTLTVQNGIVPSMSRKATPLENAPIESFFSSLKTECINLEKPKTIQCAKELIDEYVDFYNYKGYN